MLQKFDDRNKGIKIWVKDGLYPRDEAKVSVFDSVVQGGDAVWEGLRVYDSGIFVFDRHLDRLFDSAHAMKFENIPTRATIMDAVFETLRANKMYNDVHVRLTLTRGEKITSGMDPRLNQFGCTLIVVPEYKPPVYDNEHGISVITSSIRRNNPAFVDSKIHHTNLINNILAKIQSNVAGADAALMLDKDGFAAELNGTNIFTVKKGMVYTPFADACLHGVTRGLVLELCQKNNVPITEKNLSLTEIYSADEMFCSGTMGELTPIYSVDGRSIVNKSGTKVLPSIIKLFEQIVPEYCVKF